MKSLGIVARPVAVFFRQARRCFFLSPGPLVFTRPEVRATGNNGRRCMSPLEWRRGLGLSGTRIVPAALQENGFGSLRKSLFFSRAHAMHTRTYTRWLHVDTRARTHAHVRARAHARTHARACVCRNATQRRHARACTHAHTHAHAHACTAQHDETDRTVARFHATHVSVRSREKNKKNRAKAP